MLETITLQVYLLSPCFPLVKLLACVAMLASEARQARL